MRKMENNEAMRYFIANLNKNRKLIFYIECITIMALKTDIFNNVTTRKRIKIKQEQIRSHIHA